MTQDPDYAHSNATRPARGRFAGARAKLVLLTISTCAALAAGEITVRRFFHDELDTDALRKENRNLSIGNLIEPSEDPERLYQLRRGLFEEWFDVLVATSENARARISTVYPPPAAPAIGIALIGDSSSFGYRVYSEASYPAALRVALENDFGFPIEIRNYSTPGYNSTQERAMLEHVLAEWKPDLVILHYDHNDPDPQSAAPPGYIPPEYGDNVLGSKLLKLALRRIRVQRNEGSRIFVAEDGSEEWLFGSLRSGGPRYDAHLEELRRMGALLESAGIPAVAVIYEHGTARTPSPKEHPHFIDLHTPLLPVLEEAGFHVLDLYPEYQALMTERNWPDLRPFWVSEKDSHPNAYGHAFIAEHLRRFILESAALRGRLESAAKDFSGPPIDSDRNEAAGLFQRSLVLIDLKRLDEAREQLSNAIARSAPADTAPRMTMARVHILQNNPAEAAAELEKVVEGKPDYSTAHMQLSRLYAYQERYRETLEHHDIARETAKLPEFRTANSEGLAAIFQQHAAAADEKGDPALAAALRSQAIILYRLAGRDDAAASLLKGFDRFQPDPSFP